MASKWSDLLWLSIVTYANDWNCCLLDHADHFSDSSSVALAHTVDLVHYHQFFYQLRRFVKAQRVRFKEQNALLVTNVTCVELYHIKVQLLSQKSGSGCLANTRVTAEQCCPWIHVTWRQKPSSFDLNRLLVTFQNYILPVLEPFPQHFNLATLPYNIIQRFWLVFFCPQNPKPSLVPANLIFDQLPIRDLDLHLRISLIIDLLHKPVKMRWVLAEMLSQRFSRLFNEVIVQIFVRDNLYTLLPCLLWFGRCSDVLVQFLFPLVYDVSSLEQYGCPLCERFWSWSAKFLA